jgi:hypothetical protein
MNNTFLRMMSLGQTFCSGASAWHRQSMSLQEQFEEASKLASSGSNAGLKGIDTEKQKKLYGWFKQVFGLLLVVSGKVVQMCVKSCNDLTRVTSRTPRGEGDTSANPTGRLPIFLRIYYVAALKIYIAAIRLPARSSDSSIALTCEDMLRSTKASIWRQEQRQVQQWRQKTLMWTCAHAG